jgi:SHS2 domain-containing protein
MKGEFVELPHTADLAVRLRAPDLAGLMGAAAEGMNALAGLRLEKGPRISRGLTLESPDAESLLVAFLSELAYLAEHERLGFDEFDLETAQSTGVYSLRARMEGARIEELGRPIKAVTFHNMEIAATADGLEVEVVFDV